MRKDNQLQLDFPTIFGKKVEATFDGGNITSDGGVLFLRMIEDQTRIVGRIVSCLPEGRDKRYVQHSLRELVEQRVYQISCGYEDANDCNDLRSDPAFKTVCGRNPESDSDLASQPTMTRLENSVSRTTLYRLAGAFIDSFIDSYVHQPRAIILDIDDTDDTTHGAQQLSMFNGYHNEYCYQPMHIYEGQSGKLITTILRPGKRPSGKDIVSILKRVVSRIRKIWPKTEIIVRGDSHFSTPEVHDYCEEHDVHYVLGQTGNKALLLQGAGIVAQAKRLYDRKQEKVRLYHSMYYQAGSWSKKLRIVMKVEVSTEGTNVRFVTTDFERCRASFVYEKIYCARGRMELFIKNHKTYLHSDRTSCHRFTANQFRLFLHSAAYVLLHDLSNRGLRGTNWAGAQFDTIQKRLLKVGARIQELVTRIKIHFPTSFPLKNEYFQLVSRLAPAPT